MVKMTFLIGHFAFYKSETFLWPRLFIRGRGGLAATHPGRPERVGPGRNRAGAPPATGSHTRVRR
jgi:hypothetical protein